MQFVQSQIENNEYGKNLPSTQQYLGSVNFTGGYSINLVKTIERFDEIAERIPQIYPPKIREMASAVIETGNEAGETLVNIHKRVYSGLKDCFNLEDAKAKYPEFEGVIEDSKAMFHEGTLFDKIKKGELEHFDSDEDVSFQLLKLYWGDGFSLNDLKKYAGGADLSHTMKKLQIPTVDRTYGHVLKFSDVDYNERLTKQMAENRALSIERKLQEADGEPIFIRRGALSDEHKQHISESLKKFYEENPHKILEMSERQKEFYRNNPEKAEVFRRVMDKAWSYNGAQPIKKAMSNFMKGKGFKDFSSVETHTPVELSKKKSSALKAFWDLNPKYRAKMGENIKGAWKKVKEENETYYELDLFPMKVKDKFYDWLEKKGLDPEDYDLVSNYYPHKPELKDELNAKFRHISVQTSQFVDDYPGNESQKMADTYSLAINKTYEQIDKLYKKTRSPHTKKLVEDMKICTLMLARHSEADTQLVQRTFSMMLQDVADSHSPKLLEQMYKNLDDAYEFVEKHDFNSGEGMTTRLNELLREFVFGKKVTR